jgi:hypothetical protein
MRPGFSIQIGGDWREKSEREPGVASFAIAAELGSEWLVLDPELGEARAVDGVHGRGAAGWIPVIEWLGLNAAGGVISLAAGQAARRGIERIRDKIGKARSEDYRVLVSRGLAALLAMEYVFETRDESEVLSVEFVQEPSVLAGRPPSEVSYTGLEPWIVSLVNGSRKIRYILVVSPQGDIQGCIVAQAGKIDPLYGLLPPVE